MALIYTSLTLHKCVIPLKLTQTHWRVHHPVLCCHTRHKTVQYLRSDWYLIAPCVVALVHPHHTISKVPQCVQTVLALL